MRKIGIASLLVLATVLIADESKDVLGDIVLADHGIKEGEIVVDLTGVSGPDEAHQRLLVSLKAFMDGHILLWEDMLTYSSRPTTLIVHLWSGTVRVFGSSVENVEAVKERIEGELDDFFGRSFGELTFQLYEGTIIIDLTP